MSLQPESIAVRAVVEAAVADYEELARAHGISIKEDVPRELAIEADRVAIETVLRNLLDNAIKACVDGGRSGTMRIHRQRYRRRSRGPSVCTSADDGDRLSAQGCRR